MKPAAHLTSHLLARKGEALPVDISSPGSSRPGKAAKNAHWATLPSARSLKKSAVPKAAKPGQSQAPEDPDDHEDHSGRVAMTLRLDPRQHRRLRLVSVHSHQSAREIMAAALEIYLEHLENELDIASCDCLNLSR